jgi:hypothetical protein
LAISNGKVSGSLGLAVAADGLAVAAWPERARNEISLRAAVSSSPGSFGPAQTLDPGPDLGHYFSVAAGEGGHAAVAWSRPCPAASRVALLDVNQRFRQSQGIENSRCPSVGLRIALDAVGRSVMLVSGRLDVMQVRASYGDSEGTFTRATKISEGTAVGGELAVSESGRAVALWGRFRRSGQPRGIVAAVRPPGGQFEDPQRISGARGVGLEALAMNRRGDSVAVWQSSGSHRLLARGILRSGGVTDVERASPPLSPKTLAAPAASVSPSGRPVVAWAGPQAQGTYAGVFNAHRRVTLAAGP